jgi:SAM-dependent methyltransferase
MWHFWRGRGRGVKEATKPKTVLEPKTVLRPRNRITVLRPQVVTDELRQLLRLGMTFNTPLSEERAAGLVARLETEGVVLDLGCGWGELLLRLVAASPQARGRGLDLDLPSLERGRRLAAERGLADRVSFEAADVTKTDARGRVVVCIGVSWAWGPARAALAALRRHVEPGGLLLYGDAFWQSAPSPEAHAIFGDLPDHDGLVALAQDAGFEVQSSEPATLEEWDAFQAASLVGVDASTLPEARAFGETRRREYASYRGALGFAYLVAR